MIELIYKYKGWIITIATTIYILGLCSNGIYWVEKDLNEYNKKWERQVKIDEYYQNKQCMKWGCEEVGVDCKEYCYDKEVKGK